MSLPSPAPRALEPEPEYKDERYPRYSEALHQLARDDAMREAGQTVMRTDVTPAEHALLLAARKLAAARQASTSADAASAAAYKAAATALNAVTAARQQHDAALAALVYPATRSTGEADCS